jgi:two-component system, chemotaxis family, protein-glutamate methylesterase/glutaminase
MPQNALEHVDVDHVLSVAEMGSKFAALAREPTPRAAPVPDRMAAETQIELRGYGLDNGVMGLGKVSPNACPECHGSLVEIREGTIARYRCHAGHSYSLRTLLAETEVAIERSLWSAVRAIEERSFLLRSMEGRARAEGDLGLGERLAEAADRDEENAQGVRALIVGPSPA